MKLMLKWMSKEKRQYSLGVLEKIDGKYIFETNEEQLKKAIQDGCMGIGNFTFLEKRMESEELFTFFKSRIPDKNSWKINEVLKKYNLDKYDEMKLLLAKQGRSINDRYWVEEMQ